MSQQRWPTIWNPSVQLDVAEFEDCVRALQDPSSVGMADESLRHFSQQPGAFMRIDGVLRSSQSAQAQHIALGVLSDAVHTRWHTLEPGVQVTIRNFVAEFVFAVGTNRVALDSYRYLVVKAASTLISVAKHEWPERWPSFVTEVLASGDVRNGASLEAVQNAMLIMQLLLEEIFECGERTMTTAWVVRKKAAITQHLPDIFELCCIFANSHNNNNVPVDAVARSFETLATLIPCLEAHVLVSDVRFAQLSRSLTCAICEPQLRTPAIKCLHELATLSAAAVEILKNNEQQENSGPAARGSALSTSSSASSSSEYGSRRYSSQGSGGSSNHGGNNSLSQLHHQFKVGGGAAASSPYAQLVAESLVHVIRNCEVMVDDYMGPKQQQRQQRQQQQQPGNVNSGGNNNNNLEDPLEARLMTVMSRSGQLETFFQSVAVYASSVIADFLPTLLLAAAPDDDGNGGASMAPSVLNTALAMVNGGGTQWPIPRPVVMSAMKWVSRLFIALAYSGTRESLKIAVDFWWMLGELLVRRRSTMVRDLVTELDDLEDIRLALVRNMARPEEVTIFEDEDGELQHQQLSDVESVQLYVSMREALIFVAHVDPRGMESNMMELLQRQLNRTEWNWAALNSLCWSYGAISGSFKYDEEKSFFVNFVKNLLSLCSGMRGQSNRAVIASGVMYVLGQYPQFLSGHPRFLRTVLNKLHEFFKEPFPGIKEMAVDTLLKINSRCAGSLWGSTDHTRQPPVPQAVSLVLSAEETAMELNQHERCTFYEAMGFFAASAPTRQDAERIVHLLLDGRCNQVLSETVHRTSNSASGSGDFLSGAGYDDLRTALHCCRVIARVAKTCGPCFMPEMSTVVFPAMQTVVPLFAQRIAHVVEAQGPMALQHQNIRVLKQLKREFLKITEHFVASTDNPEFLVESVFPHVFGFIINDYAQSHPATRDAEVLALVTAAVIKSGDYLSQVSSSGSGSGSSNATATIQHILTTLYEPTVELISSPRSEEYPEHRINFFKLLDALCQHCFEPFLAQVRDNSQIMDGIFWAMRHSEPRTSEVGCRTLIILLNRIRQHGGLGPAFCEHYLARMFDVAVDVLMDRMHQQGTELQCALLLRLFAMLPMMSDQQSSIVVTALVQKLRGYETLTGEQISVFLRDVAQICNSLGSPSVLDELNSLQVPEHFVDRVRDLLVVVKIWNADALSEFDRRREVRELENALEGFERPMLLQVGYTSGEAANDFTAEQEHRF